MSANANINSEDGMDIVHEICTFALNAGMGTAALIGVWGIACLFGGLTTNGLCGLMRGFWTAVTGN